MVKAIEPPKTTINGRARVAMITVAKNVLSGNSRTNIRAKMPTNAPTVTSPSKLFAHRRGERETHAHPLDVLEDGLPLAGQTVRVVEGLDLVGQGRVVDEGADTEGQVRQGVRREVRQRLVPARGDE